MGKRIRYRPGDIVDTIHGYGIVLLMKLRKVNILMLNNGRDYYMEYGSLCKTLGETDINLLNHILDIK